MLTLEGLRENESTGKRRQEVIPQEQKALESGRAV